MLLVFSFKAGVRQRQVVSMDCALQERFQKEYGSWYGELLAHLDDAAARQIREELSQLAQLTEPHVAHDLSQALPRGNCYCHGCQCAVCTWQDVGTMSIHRGLACRVTWLCRASMQKLRQDRHCAGNGLFLGNSMPIRDMDMYGACRSSPSSPPAAAPQVNLLQSSSKLF